MRFIIYEIDNDYRTLTSTEEKNFDSWEEAEAYCKEESWKGYSYYIDTRGSHSIQEYDKKKELK